MSTSSDLPGIAVDIGGSKIAVAVAERLDDVRVVRARTPVEGGADAIVDAVRDAVRRLVGDAAIRRIVVASAGSLDTVAGVVRWASNLPFAEYPLADRIEEVLGAPVTLVGDTTAATVAEFSVPSRCTVTNGIYVTVSSGIGVGMLFGGRLYTGDRGRAGELGHIPVEPRGSAACRCGKVGCLEAYASGTGLVDRTMQMLDGQDATNKSSLAAVAAKGALSARAIVEAARRGDPIATPLVDEAIERLAIAVAGLIQVLGPEVVVLGGGLMLAYDLMDRVSRRVRELLPFDRAEVASLLTRATHADLSSLEGARAICRGEPRALSMGVEIGWV